MKRLDIFAVAFLGISFKTYKMKRLLDSKLFLSAFLAFFIGAIMTYLDEPKTVELKGAIFGGFKFSIIMLVITIVTDNFSSFNKKKE